MATDGAGGLQPSVGKASVQSFDDAVSTLFQIFGADLSEGALAEGANDTLAVELQVRRCLQELLLQQEVELRERHATESLRRQELWRQAEKASQRRRREVLLREAAEEESRGRSQEQKAEAQRLADWEAQLREREQRLVESEGRLEEARSALRPAIAVPPFEQGKHTLASPARARRFNAAEASPVARLPSPGGASAPARPSSEAAAEKQLPLVPPLPGGEGPDGRKRRTTSRKQIRDPGRAQELFESIDANHDGVLTRSEFGKAYGLAASGQTASARPELFDRLDTDGDGVVSRVEFVAGYCPASGSCPETSPSPVSALAQRLAPAVLLSGALSSGKTARPLMNEEPELVHCSPVRDLSASGGAAEKSGDGAFEDAAEDEVQLQSRGSRVERGGVHGTPGGSTRSVARHSSDSVEFAVPGFVPSSSTPRPQNLLARLTSFAAAIVGAEGGETPTPSSREHARS